MTGVRVSGAVVFVVLISAMVMAQQPQAATPSAPPQSKSKAAQLRDDLNKMESLNMNMSSEIEFLHDQNLQILLRTNSQMWTILIRDMQRQLARQEEQNAVAPSPARK